MADVAATILTSVGRSGRLWWSEWDGLQWSPANVATGRPYRGADRLVLATYALVGGHADRRWGTIAQLDGLSYRIRRIDRARGVVIGDELLYNAELGRRKRGTGARHDSPIPAEEYVRDDGAREVLKAAKILAPPQLACLDTAGLAWLLRAMALTCMPKGHARTDSPGGVAALRPLAADMACAMALSDLGIAPLRARGQDKAARDTSCKPWIAIARTNPNVLAACADLAELTVSVMFSRLLIEGRKARALTKRRPTTKPAVKPQAHGAQPEDATSHATERPIEQSSVAEELYAITAATQPSHARDASHHEQGATGQDYTLHEEAEASRLASKALAGMSPTARQGVPS